MQRFLAVAQELRADRVASTGKPPTAGWPATSARRSRSSSRRRPVAIRSSISLASSRPAKSATPGAIRRRPGGLRRAQAIQAPADPRSATGSGPGPQERPLPGNRTALQPADGPAGPRPPSSPSTCSARRTTASTRWRYSRAEYEGKTVSWSGELKRLRRFDHDRDFGDGPAVKAVFCHRRARNRPLRRPGGRRHRPAPARGRGRDGDRRALFLPGNPQPL